MCRDVKGDEYLEFVERQTKTRTGATDEARTVPPRMITTHRVVVETDQDKIMTK
ncbi:hypothetical protein DPMN_025659 [Dreissena polymorpha]|uniref:Uncharacterized protein n=1 Tax=Dreissena polymorpha TaxID=45954 RepID=A0A9D4LRH4_DREPO|nr:hypothetical protein DPMN_025659 [Dreissena polymorpha]